MAIGTTTAIVISAVTAALSASIGAYSAIASAEAQASAEEYNAKIAANNAAAAHRESMEEAARSRAHSRRVIAAQRAQMAKSGGAISGSALDVLGDSAIQAELDALSIQYRGAVSSTRERNQADLSRRAAKNLRSSKGYTIGASVLGAANQGLGTYGTIKSVNFGG